MKALIIDEPWISLIIAGKKTWEMRSRDTRVRGPIGLIRKGSKCLVGAADLVDTVRDLSVPELRANVVRHRVHPEEIGPDFKWRTAWVLDHARALDRPLAYEHPAGAVIWVNLDPSTTRMVEEEITV